MTHSIETSGIQISTIRVRPLLVPLRRPLATAVGHFTHGPFLAIDLSTTHGATGRMLGFTFSRLGLTVIPPLLEALTRFAQGLTITFGDIERFHDAAQRHLTLLGHEGVAQFALSMFDMAVHDALAQTAGIPLYQLIGGSPTSIPAYNSCGLGLLSAPAAAREAKELVREHHGFSHVKMRLGRPRFADDVKAIQAVRDALGPTLTLSVDFNQHLAATEALQACRAIDHFDLAWIEEPIVYDDYPAQSRLAAKLATPLQIGENWWSWRVGKMAIEMHACDYVMPDILRIGGITGWRRLARVAEMAAVPFSSHLSPEYSVHALAATATRHWLEYMDWGQVVIKDPLVPQNGFVQPRTVSGAGIEWDEAAVLRYAAANL